MARAHSPKKPQAPSSAAAAVEMLVRQFAQPLAFLRELVQNSLDAGSNTVEVSVTYAEAERLACIKVADSGEGMDREIIDSGLTRLFASSKDQDLTKIGKFGIGFVSVFSLQPEAVVVDTGRNGEYWRLVFHPDRSFDRIRRDQPWDGTTVSVYHRIALKKFPAFVQDCQETVTYWCKHCDVPILFNGRPINQEFSLSPGGQHFEAYHQAGGTEVVVACLEGEPSFGFYNRGLTLMEGTGRPPGEAETLPGFSFKVRSRYLEHTLTRDTIIRDHHFQKAMAVAHEAAGQIFPKHLLEGLAQQARPKHWQALVAWIRCQGESTWPWLRHARIIPTWNGEKIPLLKVAEGSFYAPERDDLVDAVLKLKDPPLILRGGAESPWWPATRLLIDQDYQPRPLRGAYVLAEEVHPERAWARVQKEAQTQLRRLGVTRVFLGRWISAPPGSALASLYLRPGQAQRAEEKGKCLCIHDGHPSFARLLQVSRHDPSLACLLLLHRCLLELALPRDKKLYHGLFQAVQALRQP